MPDDELESLRKQDLLLEAQQNAPQRLEELKGELAYLQEVEKEPGLSLWEQEMFKHLLKSANAELALRLKALPQADQTNPSNQLETTLPRLTEQSDSTTSTVQPTLTTQSEMERLRVASRQGRGASSRTPRPSRSRMPSA